MRAQEFLPEDTVHRGGIDVEELEDAEDPSAVWIQATAHGRELGLVKFYRSGDTVVAQSLEVKPEYRGQGIARIMYDYARELGYRVLRSAEQTQAGHDFWEKHRPRQGVWEDQSPQWLYHATYRPLLASIKQHGLGGSQAQAQWEDSQPGVVYLAINKDIAESYAEANDLVPEEWLDEIVVLKIETGRLDPKKLHIDRNVQDNTGDTLEYHGVIPVGSFSLLNEVQILSKVKGKGSEPSRLPKLGREIPTGQEERYLGRYVADIRPGQQLWQQYVSGEMNYHLFDTNTRRAVMTMFGTRYPRNPQSLIVSGVYASPDNTMRASDFYRFLIVDQGITMVSDRKQSPGGQNIWRQLERFPDVEVYGMDTRTGKIVNIGAADEEMYAVPPGAAQDRESRYTAKNIRLVATRK
jgi:GNAT superfamily N-acetyltransferase